MALSPIVIVVLLFSLCLGAFFFYTALRSRLRKAGAGRLDPLGMQARVNTALEPDGSIILNGELWRARARHSMSPLLPGHTVRIVGVDGHFLVVEPTE